MPAAATDPTPQEVLAWISGLVGTTIQGIGTIASATPNATGGATITTTTGTTADVSPSGAEILKSAAPYAVGALALIILALVALRR